MTKSAPLFSPAGMLGGLGLCLLAWPVGGRAQSPTATPPARVETAATDENKPDENNGGSDTEILASQGATFTAKDRIAVFNGDVRVRDPRFTLACDELTVFLAKGAAPGATPSPTPLPTPPPVGTDPKSKDTERPSGIDHAVAKGHVIIIQKRAPTKAGEEEKITIARSDTAEYDGKTGDMTLRGMPKIEQNGNRTEALSNSTFIVIHSDNSMKIIGPSRNIIVQHAKNADTPGKGPAASPAANKRTSAAPQS